jgi:hypothetical protein
VLATLPAPGGAPSTVLDLTDESAAPLWPQLLPRGGRALVTVIGPNDFNGPTLEVVSLRDGAHRAVFRGGTFGRYIERDGRGYLLYVNQGALFALPFDAVGLTATGPAFPVVDDVAYSPSFGFAQLDVTATGTLVYRRDRAGGRSIAALIDRAGRVEPLDLPPGRYLGPRLSPDGRSLALGAVESGVNTTLIHEPLLDRTTRLQIAGRAGGAAWLPDGHCFVLGGAGGLAWLRLGPGATPRPFVSTSGPAVPWSFAPENGRELLYRTDNGRVMVVEYSTANGAFTVDKPKQWTPIVLADTGVAPTFDLAPDDERIVALVPASEPKNGPGRNEITLIFDVFPKLLR